MPRYRKKVCREYGRVYRRRYVRTSGTLGWCSPNCYRKSYFRRREGKAVGEPPDPFDDRAIQEPRVMENLAEVLQEESMKEEAMAEERTADEIENNGETGILHLDVVANRALVPQKRFGEDNLAGVEWMGRCWVWLTEGETPALMDVVVNDGEIVKLLEPRRVGCQGEAAGRRDP